MAYYNLQPVTAPSLPRNLRRLDRQINRGATAPAGHVTIEDGEGSITMVSGGVTTASITTDDVRVTINGELVSLPVTIATLKQANIDRYTEIGALRTRMDAVEPKVATAQNHIATLQQNNLDRYNEIQALKTRTQAAEDALASANYNFQQLKNWNEQLRDILAAKGITVPAPPTPRAMTA